MMCRSRSPRVTSPSWIRAGSSARPLSRSSCPLQAFYPAEGYHQDYLLENPTAPYIVYNDLPKIRNFQRLLPVLYQAKAVTVTEFKQYRNFQCLWRFWSCWASFWPGR